ncbi:MAG: hypothetical protein AB7F59_09500 [Bdellovibrionales bacterium]
MEDRKNTVFDYIQEHPLKTVIVEQGTKLEFNIGIVLTKDDYALISIEHSNLINLNKPHYLRMEFEGEHKDFHIQYIERADDSDILYRIKFSSSNSIIQRKLESISTKRPDFDVNRRTYSRIIPSSPNLKFFIYLNGVKAKINVSDLTPFGAACVIDAGVMGNEKIALGSKLNCAIVFGANTLVDLSANVVWARSLDSKYHKIGLEFSSNANSEENKNEGELNLGRSYITGAYFKPFIFAEKGTFLIQKISKTKITFQIIRPDLVLANTEIKLNFLLPNSSKCWAKVKVLDNKIIDKKLIINAEILEFSQLAKAEMASFLLLFHGFNPTVLKRAGLVSKTQGADYEFSYAATKEEYKEVLALRSLCYKGAGKLKADASIVASQAPLDDISRIVFVKHQGRPIASVALSFPSDEDVVLDVERGLGRKLPQGFPRKNELVEISRLCIHPDYQSSDLLIRMVQEMAKVVIQSDRRYIVSSTDEKMWPFYKVIGWKKTELEYDHPFLSNLRHTIIIGDRERKAFSVGINPLIWHESFGKTMHYFRPNWLRGPLLKWIMFSGLKHIMGFIVNVLQAISIRVKR